ncbi:MAG: SRPBCC family protein [Paracoccaceae bacterium]
MKLTTKQDIEAPLDVVYQRLTDFDHFERMAMRRGAEVERTDRLKVPGVGMAWRLHFVFRSKPRTMLVRFADAEPESHLIWGFDSTTLEGAARIDLVALSARRTRMSIAGEARPKTLAARLVLQSMRLAKGRLQRKFDVAAGKLANMVEEQFRAASSR